MLHYDVVRIFSVISQSNVKRLYKGSEWWKTTQRERAAVQQEHEPKLADASGAGVKT